MTDNDAAAERLLSQIKTGDYDFEVSESLRSAFHNGFRLDALTELIESTIPEVSTTGVLILEELSLRRPAVQERKHLLRGTALKLARNTDAWRRKVSIEFCMRAQFYDDAAVKEILKSLKDTDLHVRCWAMDWVLNAPNSAVFRLATIVFGEQIASHEELVAKLSSIDRFDRQLRALKIAVMTKSGRSVEGTLNEVGLEDSFTYEMLLHNEANHWKGWEKMPDWQTD